MSSFLSSLFSIFRGTQAPEQLAGRGIHTSPDSTTIRLENRAGQQITIQENTITIQDNAGNRITLDAGGIHLQAASRISIDAAQLTVNTAMLTVNGTVKCDTIIASNVVGTTYTPGAGNLF